MSINFAHLQESDSGTYYTCRGKGTKSSDGRIHAPFVLCKGGPCSLETLYMLEGARRPYEDAVQSLS